MASSAGDGFPGGVRASEQPEAVAIMKTGRPQTGIRFASKSHFNSGPSGMAGRPAVFNNRTIEATNVVQNQQQQQHPGMVQMKNGLGRMSQQP